MLLSGVINTDVNSVINVQCSQSQSHLTLCWFTEKKIAWQSDFTKSVHCIIWSFKIFALKSMNSAANEDLLYSSWKCCSILTMAGSSPLFSYMQTSHEIHSGSLSVLEVLMLFSDQSTKGEEASPLMSITESPQNVCAWNCLIWHHQNCQCTCRLVRGHFCAFPVS